MAGVAGNSAKKAAMKVMRLVIEHTKTAGASTFDKWPTASAKLIDGDVGRCLVELKVCQEHTNLIGTLHGGFSATLVDTFTSCSLLTPDADNVHKMGVSVNLSLEYMKAAKVGEDIIVDAKVLKRGKNLAFLEAEIRNKETNALLVKGSHTKYIL